MQENATYSPDRFICRAKVLQTGQWIQGYLYQKTKENEKKSYVIADSIMSPGSLTKPDMIEVDPESICSIPDIEKMELIFGKTIRFSIILERKSELFDLEDTKTALTLKLQNTMAFTWSGVKVFI